MRMMFIHTTLALLLGAVTASAQQPADRAAADARWQPWIGCWQLVDESVRDQYDVSAEDVLADMARGGTSSSRRNAASTRVCVAPAARGVTLTTMVGSQRALEETLVADGSEQPITDNECRGTKRSEWSKSGFRVFTRAEVACKDQMPRRISSLTMMLSGPNWLDVQLIDVSGRRNIRVHRYEKVPDESAQTRTRAIAPFVGESAWSIDDVKEATAKLAPEVVQAALAEMGAGFNLNGKTLIALDDAGVPDSVIDLMVALTYPKRFVIDRPSRASAGYGGGGIYGGFSGLWPFMADAAFWPSYYSPYAYGYWGRFDPYYLPYYGYVPIGNVEPGSNTPTASGTGRVVDGRGYTRVTTRAPEPVRVNGYDGGGSNGTMSNGGGSNGSSGGVSSGGYSSGGGGGGGDGGRTAVPRPPGGN